MKNIRLTHLVSALGLFALTAPLASGCVAEEPEGLDDENPMMQDEAIGTFDRNTVITDVEMLDSAAFSAAEVDAFLKRPYPHLSSEGSCLSRMTFGGKSAGTIIVETSKKYGLNPLFLLTHLQKESSLIGNTAQTCSQSRLDKAFGCGCPDNQACDPTFTGFQKQLDCAGKLTKSYLDDLATKGYTIANWKVGAGKKTLDGYTVTPKGKAAAVLYTYTPWVGDKSSGGNPAPFGNYLFWKVWGGYAKTLDYNGPAPACTAVFVDICGSAHQADIEWMVAQDLTSGCDAQRKLFCPDASLSRGQMADFLARALKLPQGPEKFTDDNGSPYEASINAVAAAGITAGCNADGTQFCPDAPITRGQMAVFLARAFDLPEGPDAFVDDEGSLYEDGINAIAAAGITAGCDAAKKTYCPDQEVTRAQMATFLHRAMD
jgi:hypothetical protein